MAEGRERERESERASAACDGDAREAGCGMALILPRLPSFLPSPSSVGKLGSKALGIQSKKNLCQNF